MTSYIRIFLVLVICGVAAVAAETIIVNAGLGASEVSKDELKAMFEGKKANWSGGAKVVLVIQPDAAAHESFLATYVGRTPSQFAAAWKKIVFTGKASAPVNKASDAEVVATVAQTPGAVGYLGDASAAAGNAGVTVVSVK